MFVISNESNNRLYYKFYACSVYHVWACDMRVYGVQYIQQVHLNRISKYEIQNNKCWLLSLTSPSDFKCSFNNLNRNIINLIKCKIIGGENNHDKNGSAILLAKSPYRFLIIQHLSTQRIIGMFHASESSWEHVAASKQSDWNSKLIVVGRQNRAATRKRSWISISLASKTTTPIT